MGCTGNEVHDPAPHAELLDSGIEKDSRLELRGGIPSRPEIRPDERGFPIGTAACKIHGHDWRWRCLDEIADFAGEGRACPDDPDGGRFRAGVGIYEVIAWGARTVRVGAEE